MRRRTFLAAAGALVVPLRARAQAKRAARLGILLYDTPQTDPTFPSLRVGLRELGYAEGDFSYVIRYAEGKPEKLPALAAELVQLKPDVLLVFGGDVAPFASAATSTIPIVVSVSSDPVEMRLVATLARPGGNVTGITFVSSDLTAKRMEILRQFLPRVARVGMIWNPDHFDPEYREAQRTGKALGVSVQSLEVRREADADGVFRAARDSRIEAIMPVSSRLLFTLRPQIFRFAADHRLPVAAGWGPWAAEGALFSYGPDLQVFTRRLGYYVDRVLKGAKPADIPIEQPTRFELVVNARAAKALGLTVPESLRFSADRVIE